MFGFGASGILKSLAEKMIKIIEDSSGDHKKKLSGTETPPELLDIVGEMISYERAVHYGLLHSLPMAFLYIDTEDRVLYTNRECMQLLQIDAEPESYSGISVSEIFYNEKGRVTLLSKCTSEGARYKDKELIITSRKGNKLNVLCNLFPLHDKNGKCFGGMGMYQDITTQRNAEKALEKKKEDIAQTASRLDGVVRCIKDLADDLLSLVRDTSADTREQTKHLDGVHTAINDMHSAIQSIAGSASQASNISGNARESASNGAKSVNDVLADIAGMQKLSLELKADMGKLGAQAAGISNILSVISDIADQTNLLALNAAIEAARAGDAGRGFAVVADEVRKLAEKTMKATDEVATAIAEIQKSTKANADTVDRTVATIEGTVNLASRCGTALQEIVDFSGQTSDEIQNIAASSEQQSAASEHIVNSVILTSDVSKGIEDRMSGCLDGLNNLDRQIQELRDLAGNLVENL
ncbi:MAG: methyl-accepting chemotaxis protein [Desulfovibrio sp.]|jgi:methyl-accepting chemotaxis protein|nr:methyl-accepting chemotaxis protein [Desulfovibrio sp.]